jgi:hypothetical protein
LGKVEKFRNPLILWQLVGNYSLNIVMLDFIFSPHNVVTWVYLFPPHKNILYLLHLPFFSGQIVKILSPPPHQKNKTDLNLWFNFGNFKGVGENLKFSQLWCIFFTKILYMGCTGFIYFW